MHRDWTEVLSGERQDAFASLLRGALSAAVPLYGAGVYVRTCAYDRGWKHATRVAAPVISVGNLTTGGTGKTPVVAWAVQRLQGWGLTPGILSRGYGRMDATGNDEKLVLDQLCPGVPHIQQPDRAAAAQMLITNHGCDVLLLDDGFQHRRLARDLDLVLIDALQPWGYGSLLPRGLLREPRSALRRAHLIGLTRADQVDSETRERMRQEIAAATAAPVVEIAFVPTGLVNTAGTRAPLSRLHETTLGACCGIGHPQAFRRTLTARGAPPTPERFRAYPDHHRYTPADLADLAGWVRATGIEVLVVTQKDLVKLPLTHIGRAELWALEISVEFLSGGQTALDLLRDALSSG